MRQCPFNTCGEVIADDMFACPRHWAVCFAKKTLVGVKTGSGSASRASAAIVPSCASCWIAFTKIKK